MPEEQVEAVVYIGRPLPEDVRKHLEGLPHHHLITLTLADGEGGGALQPLPSPMRGYIVSAPVPGTNLFESACAETRERALVGWLKAVLYSHKYQSDGSPAVWGWMDED